MALPKLNTHFMEVNKMELIISIRDIFAISIFAAFILITLLILLYGIKDSIDIIIRSIKDRNKIYFITCFSRYVPNTRIGVPDIGSSRTFGYYKDRSTAISAVTHNCCDIQEICYKYAVIECIEEGLYVNAEERLFFEWNNEKEIFEPIEPFIDNAGNYAFE